jgi:thymidylate kinase
MKPVLVAFCGSDGSGKSSLVQAVREALSARHPRLATAVCKNSHVEARQLIDRWLGPPRRGTGEDWDATWIALGCALDYTRFVEERLLPLCRGAGAELLLLDRSRDCCLAYAAAVRPACTELVARMMEAVPAADLTFHLQVPAPLAWERVRARAGGPGPRESLAMAERLNACYRARFAGRADVVAVDNRGSIDRTASRIAGGISALLRRRGLLAAAPRMRQGSAPGGRARRRG